MGRPKDWRDRSMSPSLNVSQHNWEDHSVIPSRNDLPHSPESPPPAKKVRFDSEEQRRESWDPSANEFDQRRRKVPDRNQSYLRGEGFSGGPSNRRPIRRLEEPFPFGKLLYEAAVYRAQPGQKLGDYCFEKITKLHALKLEIPVDYMIDAIIDGIGDEEIERLLRVRNFRTEYHLYAKMNKMGTMPEVILLPTDPAVPSPEHAEEPMFLSCEPWSVNNNVFCFNCGKAGHMMIERVGALATCLLCQQRGKLFYDGNIYMLKKVQETRD